MQEEITLFRPLLIATVACLPALCQSGSPRIFIEAPDDYSSYISAAIVKKHVPAVVTQSKESATYILTNALQVQRASTGAKVVSCLFAYCAGASGSQTATVQLVNAQTQEVIWAYNVRKYDASGYQSTAEAVAKHLKKFLNEHPR